MYFSRLDPHALRIVTHAPSVMENAIGAKVDSDSRAIIILVHAMTSINLWSKKKEKKISAMYAFQNFSRNLMVVFIVRLVTILS